MTCGKFKQLFVLIAVVTVIGLSAVDASASVVGLLRLDGDVGGVTVGLNFIDWTLPVGGGTGSFLVTGGTTLTSSIGAVPVGSTGTIKDLNAGTPLPVSAFMTFAAVPGITFDLLSVGTGAANTNCSGLAIGGSCSIFVGSPFVLTLLDINTTSVGLSASGTATDGFGLSTWSGGFTTQLSQTTPAAVQALFGCVPGQGGAACTNPSATVSSSYSGEFRVTAVPVPEPATLSLLGLGLLGLASYRRYSISRN